MSDEIEIVPLERLGGRPTKLTPEVRQRLIKSVALGVPYAHAARSAGISPASFSNWRRDHPDFSAEIDQSISAAMERLLGIVEHAAKIDASKATWLLEHRWPAIFARNRIELTGADGLPIAAGVVAVLLPAKGSVSPPLAATVIETEDATH